MKTIQSYDEFLNEGKFGRALAGTALGAGLLFGSPILGQTNQQVGTEQTQQGNYPLDKSGLIHFTEVINIDGLNKNDLYLNSKELFINIFKSAKDVIQMDNKENSIIGKGFIDIYAQKGSIRNGPRIILDFTATVRMWFTIKIETKDGKYKYDIYDIYFTGNSEYANPNEQFTAEQILLNKKYFESESSLRCKKVIDITISNIISSIKKYMIVEKTDW